MPSYGIMGWIRPIFEVFGGHQSWLACKQHNSVVLHYGVYAALGTSIAILSFRTLDQIRVLASGLLVNDLRNELSRSGSRISCEVVSIILGNCWDIILNMGGFLAILLGRCYRK